jgi:hypothetical protein
MIRTDVCGYLLHPNDLLGLSRDSVAFVNVNAVAHVDPMDIVGINQEPGIRMCSETEQRYKAEDPERPRSREP